MNMDYNSPPHKPEGYCSCRALRQDINYYLYKGITNMPGGDICRLCKLVRADWSQWQSKWDALANSRLKGNIVKNG